MQALVSVVCCFGPTTTHCVFKRHNCPKSVVCDLCHPPIRRSVCATRLWWWRWWTGRRVKMTTWSVWPTSISLTWSMRALETPTGYTTSMPTGWGPVTVNGCWFFFFCYFPFFITRHVMESCDLEPDLPSCFIYLSDRRAALENQHVVIHGEQMETRGNRSEKWASGEMNSCSNKQYYSASTINNTWIYIDKYCCKLFAPFSHKIESISEATEIDF